MSLELDDLGLTTNQIYANILRTIDNSLKSGILPLGKAVEQYVEWQQIHRGVDQLTKQIAGESNSAKRQELAKERAELYQK